MSTDYDKEGGIQFYMDSSIFSDIICPLNMARVRAWDIPNTCTQNRHLILHCLQYLENKKLIHDIKEKSLASHIDER